MQLRRRSTAKGQAVDVDEQEEADAATLDAAGKAALAMSSHDLRIKVPTPHHPATLIYAPCAVQALYQPLSIPYLTLVETQSSPLLAYTLPSP